MNALDPAVLLETFDEPLVIPRPYLQLTGGVTPSLFLSTLVALSQDLGDQSSLPPAERGWVVLNQHQWLELTSLSRYEQEAARRTLLDRNFIEERRRGMPARLGIRVRVQQLTEALRSQAHANYGSFVAARREATRVTG